MNAIDHTADSEDPRASDCVITSQAAGALQAAICAAQSWRSFSPGERVAIFERLSGLLHRHRDELAILVTRRIGKPVSMAEAEIDRSIALIVAAVAQARQPLQSTVNDRTWVRRRPVGLIAAITPWNNPIAIPIGKISPALLFGNVVAWKASPMAGDITDRLLGLFADAGLPRDVLVPFHGGLTETVALMEDARVDAVTLTGPPAAGRAALDVCARRQIPVQLELGANNASIVWRDTDLDLAASKVVDGAFAFAGQRCTANRRVVVDSACYGPFLERLQQATRDMAWGDPFSRTTRIGPLVSVGAARRIASSLGRAVNDGLRLIAPLGHAMHPLGAAYHPAIIVCCDEPGHEIVQEESFGPVLVVQRADDWDHAMTLCNGVRQGLVAALFSTSRDLQDRFLGGAQAGILKINHATADAGACAPFGGWKQSGFGPPEHGDGNREFYTRPQSVYR